MKKIITIFSIIFILVLFWFAIDKDQNKISQTNKQSKSSSDEKGYVQQSSNNPIVSSGVIDKSKPEQETFNNSKPTQKPVKDSEIRESLQQFIKNGYKEMQALLPNIKLGLKSSEIETRMIAVKALDKGIRLGALKNHFEITNQIDFKDIFQKTLNDEYAFMRRVGLNFIVKYTTLDANSINLMIATIEKETDQKELVIMISNFGWIYSSTQNESTKKAIASMLNKQARKRKADKLSRPALMAAKMLTSMEYPPEDILELVVNDIYGNSIPTLGFEVIKLYGKSSQKHLSVLYKIRDDLKNEVYKYDDPQDADYRDIKYINQLITYLENI